MSSTRYAIREIMILRHMCKSLLFCIFSTRYNYFFFVLDPNICVHIFLLKGLNTPGRFFRHFIKEENFCITKTRLYNFDPHKPHFYKVKLGLRGIYIIFLIFAKQNIDCGYSFEPPRRGSSNEYPQSMCWAGI